MILLIILSVIAILALAWIVLYLGPKSCPRCKRTMVEEFIDGKWFYMCKDILSRDTEKIIPPCKVC